ncbi:MAG: hypothetical protein L6Q71_08580, partial [Planctomycetes bacterium]|nr:hypothetical protein [Planctomycetota bacterium]
MVWQPTATTAIDFNRAWRFRVTAVRVGMFEMIALLAAWMYLPMGLQWSINQIDPTSAFDLEKTPLAGAGIQIAGTLLLLLYVTKVRGHHIAYLGFEKPHWPS